MLSRSRMRAPLSVLQPPLLLPCPLYCCPLVMCRWVGTGLVRAGRAPSSPGVMSLLPCARRSVLLSGNALVVMFNHLLVCIYPSYGPVGQTLDPVPLLCPSTVPSVVARVPHLTPSPHRRTCRPQQVGLLSIRMVAIPRRAMRLTTPRRRTRTR